MAKRLLTIADYSVIGNNDNTVNITKPTNLASGDLMIAHVGARSNTSISTPAGWTALNEQVSSVDIRSKLLYKIADSSDVSASTFDFTLGESRESGGAIICIRGYLQTDPFGGVNGTAAGSGDPITISTATPDDVNSLALLFAYTGGATVSSYALATDNPSWTELYDLFIAGSRNGDIALGYAIRPETSASGNATIDLSASSYRAGHLVFVNAANAVAKTMVIV